MGTSINTEHPAVLFNDRVTQSDFLRGGKNCSYFAVAPLDVSQQKLVGYLTELRASLLAKAKGGGSTIKPAGGGVVKPWRGVEGPATPLLSPQLVQQAVASSAKPSQPVAGSSTATGLPEIPEIDLDADAALLASAAAPAPSTSQPPPPASAADAEGGVKPEDEAAA